MNGNSNSLKARLNNNSGSLKVYSDLISDENMLSGKQQVRPRRALQDITNRFSGDRGANGPNGGGSESSGGFSKDFPAKMVRGESGGSAAMRSAGSQSSAGKSAAPVVASVTAPKAGSVEQYSMFDAVESCFGGSVRSAYQHLPDLDIDAIIRNCCFIPVSCPHFLNEPLPERFDFDPIDMDMSADVFPDETFAFKESDLECHQSEEFSCAN